MAEFISNSANLTPIRRHRRAYCCRTDRPGHAKNGRITRQIGHRYNCFANVRHGDCGPFRRFRMRCPHCTVSFHPVWEYGWIDEIQANRPCWQWTKTVCPACSKTVIKVRLRTIFGGEAPGEEAQPVHKEMWVEPSSPKRIPIGEAVPSEFREDYEESVSVLPISPKSSAALSRRVLQSMLRDQGYDRRNLADQIDLLLVPFQFNSIG